MLRSEKININGLHFNYIADIDGINEIENANVSFQFLGNSTQNLIGEYILAYNNNYVSESFNISAWDLYGSSRLGTRNVDKSFDVIIIAGRSYNWVNNTITNENIFPTQAISTKKYRLLGAKTFELTNHLGNVISTVSDRKLMVQDAQNIGYVHHYTAEILSIGEQYAFGMSMPGRTFSVEKYRYGMNTQEKDDDIFEGAFTAEYWEYDSRVGRRWNLDPIVKSWESGYACFSDNPIYFIDPNGLNPTNEKNPQGNTQNTTGLWETKQPDGSYTGKPAGVFSLKVYEFSSKSTFKDKLKTFGNKAKNLVNRIAKGFVNGIKSVTSESVAAIVGFSDTMYGLIQSSLDFKNYTTKKGKWKPIIKADGTVRSIEAQNKLNWNQNFKLKGLGLNFLSTTLGAWQVYKQSEEGIKNINIIDATALGLGAVGTVANSMTFVNLGGSTAIKVSNATGIGGLVITTGQIWWVTYGQPIHNFQQFNSPTTNNVDEAKLNQSMNNQGCFNEGDLFQDY